MGKYDKIIQMPYRGKQKGDRLSMYQRAAQFAPFAALTGHGDAINEAARLTDHRIELSETECSSLNQKLEDLLASLPQRPKVSITYFMPDNLKEGGKYVNHTGTVVKWDDFERTLVFDDGVRVQAQAIIDIDRKS